MSDSIILYSAIEKAPVQQEPFPFFGIENVISAAKHGPLLKDFPGTDSGGSFLLKDHTVTGAMAELVEELSSDRFRELIANKFDLDLTEKPLMITTRGYSRRKDGRNHTDSKSKLVTVLLYVNDDWSDKNGRLRMLNSDDIDDYVAEYAPGIGQMIAFKVTDNCWHGYKPFEGQRQSIQLNYLAGDKFSRQHRYRHKISALFKKLFN